MSAINEGTDDDYRGEIEEGEELRFRGGQRKRFKLNAFSQGSWAVSYPGFSYTKRAKSQHVSNLVRCMRHFHGIRDDAALAMVLQTLLQSESPDALNTYWRFRNQKAQARISEVFLATFHLLLRHTEAVTYERHIRFLRRSRPFQIIDEGSTSVSLLLADFMLSRGNYAEAYDLLASLSPPDSAPLLNYQRLFVMAQIRMKQWIDTMERASSAMKGGVEQQQGGIEPSKRFSYTPALWSGAGRAARQLFDECKKYLSQAAALCPERTDAAFLRVELEMSQGADNAALHVVESQHASTPFDRDCLAVWLALLLRQAESQRASEGIISASTTLLHVDPHCVAATRGAFIQYFFHAVVPTEQGYKEEHRIPANTLLHWHAVVRSVQQANASFVSVQMTTFLPAVVESLCSSLDICPPMLILPEIDLASWRCLLNCLMLAAKAVTEAYATMQESRMSFLIATLGGSDDVVNAAARSFQSAQSELENRLWSYGIVNRVLRKHAWWQEAHLSLPSSPENVAEDLANGTTNASSVLVLAAVHVAQTHAMQAMQVRALRVRGEKAFAMQVHMEQCSTAVLEGLQASGNAHEAVELSQAVQLFAQANSHAQDVEDGVIQDSSVMVAWAKERGRVDLKDGITAPFGCVHPEVGPILAQPASWWAVFPHFRRLGRNTQPAENVVTNDG